MQRPGVRSHWRSFAQHVGAEQEPGSSSKASADTGKADAEEASASETGRTEAETSTAEAESDKPEAKAGASEAEADPGASEAESSKAETDAKADAAAEGAKEAAAAEAEAEPELSPVERLQRDLEDFQDRSRGKKKDLLLALADFENTKKKFMKEREGRRRTATTNFARRMVDVYTEFEDSPALKATSTAKDEGSPCAALQEGVALTRQLFASALDKSNVETLLVEVGTPVVNARHEVVGSTPGDGSLPEGSIAEVTEQGWMIDLRSQTPQVLHKAKVKTVGSE